MVGSGLRIILAMFCVAELAHVAAPFADDFIPLLELQCQDLMTPVQCQNQRSRNERVLALKLTHCTDLPNDALRLCGFSEIFKLYISNRRCARESENNVTTVLRDRGCRVDDDENCDHVDLGNRLQRLNPNSLAGLTNLVSLDLHANYLTAVRRKYFSPDLTNLMRLTLMENQITLIEEDAFDNTPRLQHLDASTNNIDARSLAAFGDTLPRLNRPVKLECLMLADNNLQSLPADSIVRIPLKMLNISHNAITFVSEAAMSLPNLDTLDLSYNMLTEARLPGMPSLTRLYMSNNNISQCTSTDFSNVTVDSYGFSEVFALFDSLQLIDLSHNDIRVLNPNAFYGLVSLTELDLSYNVITTIHNNAFRALSGLQHLNLRHNHISTIGSTAFLGAPNLVRMFLSNNLLTTYDTQMLGVSGAQQLQTLSLRNNPIRSIRNPKPNYDSELGVVVDMTGTEISSPRDLNNMGLPAPFYVLPQAHAQCQYTTVGKQIQTKCSCMTNFAQHGDDCVDQTPGVIAGGVTGGILLGLILAVSYVAILRRHRMRQARLQDDLAMQQLLIDKAEGHIETLKRAWEIDPNEIDFVQCLDSGAFGEVWRCEWSNLIVAAKLLRTSVALMDESVVEYFEREIDFLMRCRHPNVVRFFGAGQRDGLPFLVMEYLPDGNLRSLLLNSKVTLSWQQRLSFAKDISAGLRHIHALGHMHRDVKTTNVLLSGNMRCKLTDFGTVREIMCCESPSDVRAVAEKLYGNTSSSTPLESGMRNKMSRLTSAFSSAFRSKHDTGAAPISSSLQSETIFEEHLPSEEGVLLSDSSNGSSNHSTNLKLRAANDGRRREAPSTPSGSGAKPSAESSCSFEALDLTAGQGTPMYMAPEVIRGHRYTFSADVFSFGIVLWEIAARKKPDLFEALNVTELRGPVLSTLLRHLENNERLPLDPSWPEQLRAAITASWSTEPTLRPSMDQLNKDLDNVTLVEE